jgi:hypothetical protein
MPVFGETTNESFIDFDDTAELIDKRLRRAKLPPCDEIVSRIIGSAICLNAEIGCNQEW